MKRDHESVESIDPLSEETKRRISHIDPRVDPYKLREMVLRSLLNGKDISLMSKGEQRVIEFRLRVEYAHDLEVYIERYIAERGRQTDQQAREEVVRATAESYGLNAWGSDEDDDIETCPTAEIDRPVAAGGLTALHLAAIEGDLDEVKRLIEMNGARLDVKDTGGLTPLDRAQMMCQVNVIRYLLSMSKEK